jgi:predicted nucleic acid-binding Zn ribbon protein
MEPVHGLWTRTFMAVADPSHRLSCAHAPGRPCRAATVLARVLDAAVADHEQRNLVRYCENPLCGRPIGPDQRADARCCSATCRAELSRQRRKHGTTRFCANPDCSRPLNSSHRADARCCSPSCRAALGRLRKQLEDQARSEALWAALAAIPRRRTRPHRRGPQKRT